MHKLHMYYSLHVLFRLKYFCFEYIDGAKAPVEENY